MLYRKRSPTSISISNNRERKYIQKHPGTLHRVGKSRSVQYWLAKNLLFPLPTHLYAFRGQFPDFQYHPESFLSSWSFNFNNVSKNLPLNFSLDTIQFHAMSLFKIPCDSFLSSIMISIKFNAWNLSIIRCIQFSSHSIRAEKKKIVQSIEKII